MAKAVEFVSYTGKYPHLCSGVLTVKINGEEVKFGTETTPDGEQKKYNKVFWASGGRCYFDNAKDYIEEGKWETIAVFIPEQYRQYASELEEVLNTNVPHGCCGGCL